MTVTRTAVSAAGHAEADDTRWLDLDEMADVTIVAGARRVAAVPGVWSVDTPGEQMIEIRFHRRTPVRRVRVVSSAGSETRTQEMTLWVSLRGGERHLEVLRQQFNFSAGGATEQVEDYAVQLDDVSSLQLRIVPSIDGRPAVACVRELRVASA